MKLAYSPNSPYVRKCVALAIQRGIDQQLNSGPSAPRILPW